jgi:hypothetical protein
MSLSAPNEMPWVIVVGGFLGAGKTTLLLAAARELERRGMRCAVVLNDQGDDLVDSQFASLHDVAGGEVTGGCFCCRFSELISVMDELRSHAPDVIFAEPVGSCTDISATTLQPLREYSERYQLAPYTVLVDPQRGWQLLQQDADADMRFLFAKQLEEADLICFTKADEQPDYPYLELAGGRPVRQLSAKTGDGVAAWLDEMLSGALHAGSRILDIDYERYAAAEAALAWLNLRVDLQPASPMPPACLLGPLLERLDRELTESGIVIVHLKAMMQGPTGYIKAAICGNGQEPRLEGNLTASATQQLTLLLNLRAVGDAEDVQSIVTACLENVNATLGELQISCFHPAPPKPERRIGEVR